MNGKTQVKRRLGPAWVQEGEGGAASVQAMFPGAVHFDAARPKTALDVRAEADATARAAQDAANAARATGA